MRYIAAYALAIMGGNEDPTVNDLRNIVGSVGVDFDQEQAQMVVNQLAGKDLEEVIEAGREKLAVVPCGAPRLIETTVEINTEPDHADAEKDVAADSDTDDDDGMINLFGD